MQRADALAITLIVALGGSILVRFAFFKWGNLGAFKPRVLVLGTGSRVMKLSEFAQRNQNHVVVGYLALRPTKHFVPLPLVLPMAPGESLLSVVEKHRIDEIVIAVRDRRNGELPLQQLLECRLKGVKLTELTTFFEREYRQVLLESLNPSWMVLGEGFRKGFSRALVKRAFDLTLSAVLLLITLPIMFVTALCIFLESGRPVFHRQEHSGLSGRVFTLYKLRSMRNVAQSDETPRLAEANDDRATRVGRIIRKLGIDGWPQIINVFKGEMSFVGPRPEQPIFVDQLVKQMPYYALRHCVPPGITGWEQVRSHSYGASLDDAIERLQQDLYYVKNHRLFLDLIILIATAEVAITGGGLRLRSKPYTDPVPNPKIEMPLGRFLLAIAEFLYSRKTYETCFLQTVADCRQEFNDALLAGRFAKARWIRVRYSWAFLSTCWTILLNFLLKLMWDIFR